MYYLYQIRITMSTEKNAIDSLLAQIENDSKKNKVFSFFVKLIDKYYENNRIDEMATTYNTIGARYKQIKYYDDAGKAYEKSAKLYDTLNQSRESTEQYLNAAKCYKGQIQIDNYNLAINQCIKGMNFKKAMKICIDLGKIYENDNNFNKSIHMHMKAYEYGEMDLMSQCEKNELFIKLANLGIKNGDYKFSHEIYRNLINENINNETKLLRYRMNNFIFRFILCEFILQTEHHSSIEMAQYIGDLIKKYNLLWASFEISNEYKLLIECVNVCSNDDGHKIEMIINKNCHQHIVNDPIIKKLFSDLIGFINTTNDLNGMEVIDLS